MNVAKIIEQAVSRTIRDHAELSADVVIRAWQTLDDDHTWDAALDRTFPMIDVRCGAPTVEEDQKSMRASCMVRCATKTDDDRDHATISEIFGAVQGVMEEVFFDFANGTEGGALDTMTGHLGALSANKILFGGVTSMDFTEPYDDGGLNMIGTGLRIHFMRSEITT